MQILMNEMEVAYRAGNAPACAEMFTPQGVLFSPYAFPARGRDDIEALHRNWTSGANAKQLKVMEACRSGNTGCCLVAYSEGNETGNGTSLNIVELQPDGKWLIRICSLNSDEPPLRE
jgi:ketosteroid isomerase-like protein